MTDQIPANKVREIAAAMRAAMRREEPTYRDAEFLADMYGYIRDLEALLSTPPTLADMTPSKRVACQWMQADVYDTEGEWVIRESPHSNAVQLVNRHGKCLTVAAKDVTPRPDLPSLEWPGDKKPDTSAPESTLAVGSVWSDINALTEACEESGRDQIIVSGYDGYAFIWDAIAEWWEGSTPPRAAPFTILHTGHETDW